MHMSTAAPRIETAIREHLAPVLRADGFAGSGRTFRRTVAGWIQVLGVQGSRNGGEFAVNLALQPAALPDVLGNAPDPKKITEDLCEFRRRMSESERSDMWWSHKSTAESLATAVREMVGAYERTGRRLLDDATAKGSDLNTVSATDFAAGKFNFLGFGSTHCRIAFALARMRESEGQRADAVAFAKHALEHVGGAVSLKAQIKTFLERNDA
jgi:hypothetical protein